MPPTASILALFYLLGTLVWFKIRSRKRLPFPPGPPADPLIGHLRLMPSNNHHSFFYELGKQYGDVIYLNVLGRSIIVLNSVQAAVDLLEKRSMHYSDRPYFPVFEAMGCAKNLFFMKYDKDWQLQRTMYQQYFGKNKVMDHFPLQSRGARALVRNLVSEPERRDEHLILFSTSLIMRLAYGHNITTTADPYFEIAQGVNYAAANCGPCGGTPVDMFPFLRYFPSWFPGAYFAGFARAQLPIFSKMHECPYEGVKKQMEEGTALPSFVTEQIEIMKREGTESPHRIEHVKGAAAFIYSAGAETTSSTLSFFFLAMVLYPECQAKAQEEIDMTVGSDRLPEFSDRPSLPYLESLLQETLRWMQVVPAVAPHRSMADDVYNGMFIPKGSLVIANTRALMLDERNYSNPFDFDPSRFSPKPQGRGEPYPVGHFGFGRRICPGRYFADNSLWIAIATILATLCISKSLDSDNKEITPDTAVDVGLTGHPKPFPCDIKLRKAGGLALIAQMDAFESD